MKRIIIILLFISIIFIIDALVFNSQLIQIEPFQKLTFNARDRILILAPHPDDEVLGCGGVIQKALDLNVPVQIVFLTYGDNNQWSFFVYRKHPVVLPKAVEAMGLIRHDEAIRADDVLGISEKHLIFLGYPDFSTLKIWYSHWGNRPPARGMLTEVEAVPYANAFRPGAPFKGEEIVKDLKTIIRGFRPTKIFLSHPADHNADHRALYLFSRVALWDLENEMKPTLYPYLIHYKRWPTPRGLKPEVSLIPPIVLQKDINWLTLQLTAKEVAAKYDAITQHRSQYRASKKYLLSFIRTNELFGDFAPISLTTQMPAVSLTAKSPKDLATLPEELIDQERALFVGIEKRSVALQDSHLVITTTLSRPLGKEIGISIYVFGYRRDKNFTEMPKLHIKFGALEHKIFDQDRLLPKDVIKVIRKPKEMTVSIPLEILGNPQRILTSAGTYMGAVPLDWASWRIVQINRAQ